MKRRNKKFNFKRFFIFILVVILLVFGFKYLFNYKLKNIIILNNNNYYNDEDIIESANLQNYPKFLFINKNKIRNKILKLTLVEDVKIDKKINGTIIINVIEKKILYYDRSKELYVTSNGKYKLDNVLGIPTLINYVPSEIEEKFIKKFKKIEKDIISIIS